ncbi:MAG TPA: FAD/NAD(P)-binding protein [Dyella sp.]|uniref:FAD/NAD(P)-binding protein n=1 Tax=Dyella sp. TaxID=1869338 RepID=UPI002F9497AF
MFRRVAIIGGGAAAATLISELLDRPSAQPLHLDWYTGTQEMARGVAYGTRSSRHLLNVRAASMSLFTGKPRGFLDYAQRGDSSVAGTDFLPRRLYGDYLEAEVRGTLARAADRGHDVQVKPFDVDALVPEKDGVTVIQGDESQRVDAAILAIGSLPPQPLGGVEPTVLDSGKYIVDPWRFLATAQFDPAPREVVVIGLGLTAADVLLELGAQWPQAHFIALSRHGKLPEAHMLDPSMPLDDGGELFEALRDAPDMRSWMRLMRESIADADDWRSVVDGLRPHLPTLWQELPTTERERFLRHVRWAWERVRHRMPPQVAETLAGLERDGRLLRRPGRMQHVRAEGDRLRVSVAPRGGRQPESLTADLVVQTVGLNTDVRRTKHALVRQLSTNGHVLADPLGLGLQAEPDGRLRYEGGAWPNFFAIGSMLRGTLWETTAIPEIRQQARSLAERIFAP